MDLHRASGLNQMDYSRDSKEEKPTQATDERLDSGLDSLREEEYQAVAAEFHRLRVECCEPPPRKQAPAEAGELHEWKTQVTEDGDTYVKLLCCRRTWGFKKKTFLFVFREISLRLCTLEPSLRGHSISP